MDKPTIDYMRFGSSLPEVFDRAARLDPECIALRCRLGEISYEDLNIRANHLSNRIQAAGGDVGDRVALLMPQDTPIFIAMIGALKAGRIVLVLNSDDPFARNKTLLEDAEAGLILTVRSHAEQAYSLSSADIGTIIVDSLDTEHAPEPPDIVIGAQDAAFLVYTSGSTGKPKGVMVSHGQAIRDAFDVGDTINIVPEDRILLLASLWGAQALCTTWFTLLNGATLSSFPIVENGLTGLADWITETRVSIFVSASSLFRHFIRSIDPKTRFPCVRLVKLSADPAYREDFQSVLKNFPKSRFMHNIGVTELGHLAYVIFERDAVVPNGQLPIGRPFPGVELRIVDERGRDCPRGVRGSIEATLQYLAVGYWRDKELTAKCFFSEPNGMRTFRGGDMAFVNTEGLIVHAGRNDATYKIRGHRIDTAEVERGLSGIAGVDDAAVVASARPNGQLHLVAYIAPKSGLTLTATRIRNAARASMPRYMVPSVFVFVKTLPRAANGKVDRSWLRKKAPSVLRTTNSQPATATEALLAGIWSEALELDDIGPLDDFFELGGDSLTATVIGARLFNIKKIDLDVGAFVDHPLMRELAALVDSLSARSAAECLVRTRQDEPAPLSKVQEYYWRRTRSSGCAGLVFASAMRIEGPLDIDALRQSISDIVARHEILRTCFAVQPGTDKPVQIVRPAGEVPLPLIDLSDVSNGEEHVRMLLHEETNRSFDLSKAPPILFKVARLGTKCHFLLQSSHHILADGPSWNIFLQDLAQIYPARVEGRKPTLVPLSIQYADYAAWENERWRGNSQALQEEMRWWTHELENVPRPPDGGWLRGYSRQEPIVSPQPRDWSIQWGLDPVVSARLDELARTHNTTYFALRLAAAVPVCAMATGLDETFLSVVRTTRTRVEFQSMFGPFLSYGILPLTCHWNCTFRNLLSYVSRKLRDFQKHSIVPYSLITDEFHRQRLQLPQPIMLIHRKTPVPTISFAGLKMTWSIDQYPMRPGIMASFDEIQEHRGCLLVFDAYVFSAELLQEFVACFCDFIGAAASNPDSSLCDLIEHRGVGHRLRRRRV